MQYSIIVLVLLLIANILLCLASYSNIHMIYHTYDKVIKKYSGKHIQCSDSHPSTTRMMISQNKNSFSTIKMYIMYILIVEKKFLFCEITTKKLVRDKKIKNTSFIGNTGGSSILLHNIRYKTTEIFNFFIRRDFNIILIR